MFPGDHEPYNNVDSPYQETSMDRIIAFTGTRNGMTEVQRKQVLDKLLGAAILNNGLCVGADAECLEDFKFQSLGYVHGFPAIVDASKRRDDLRPLCDVVHNADYPLSRNRVMVDRAHELVAAPSGMTEELRSGTWATVRYARKVGKPVTICWPDGTVTSEEN